MQHKTHPRPSKRDYGAYLQNTPKTIFWTVIAGNRRLDVLEEYDLIYDQEDLRIRKLPLDMFGKKWNK